MDTSLYDRLLSSTFEWQSHGNIIVETSQHKSYLDVYDNIQHVLWLEIMTVVVKVEKGFLSGKKQI